MALSGIQYTTTTDGVRIAYVRQGDGPPVVVAPGLGTTIELGILTPGPEGPSVLEFWDRFSQHFAVVRYDARGFGFSQRGIDRVSVDTLAEDLAAVVDACGFTRVAVIGQSQGGQAAIKYTAEHPDRVSRLVLLGAFARFNERERTTARSMAELYRANWGIASDALTRLLFEDTQHPQAELEAYVNKIRRTADRDAVVQLLLCNAESDVSDCLPRIAVPTMVVHSQVDRAVPFHHAQILAAEIPNAKLVPFHGDHAAWSVGEVGEEYAGLLERFLGEPMPTAARASGGHSPFRAILFTDVVSSTPLLGQLKDAKMREIMRDHDEVLEAAVTGNGGRVIKTIGDAFMAEFAVPSNAVDAAIAAHRNLRERFAESDVPVRIRIGINAGEPIEEDGDLHGASVVIAKRLESAAETNGILVSDVVKQMVTGKDFHFEDRGLVELKGFEEPVRAWAVRWE